MQFKRPSFILLISFCLLKLQVFAQDSWFTNIDSARAYAKKINQLIVLEVGSIEDGQASFIDNQTWNSTLVEKQLEYFVPASVELDYSEAFFTKHKIAYTPTLLIMDADKNVLYQDTGFKDSTEISQILSTVYNHGGKIRRLLNAYKRGESQLGRLQKAEEFLFLSYLSPNDMKTYFYNQSIEVLESFQQELSKDDAPLKNRMKIIEYGQEINAGSLDYGMEKLNRLVKDEISTNDKALSLFYLTLGAYIQSDYEASKKWRNQLTELSQGEILARDYTEKLIKLIGESN